MENICPLKYLAQSLGGKWKLPIICILSDMSPKRYSTIKRRLGGITNMMLSQSLKELESCGIVSRKQYNEIPPRVEYSLTERGKGTLPFLTEAAKWALGEMEHDGIMTHCEECRTSL